MQQLMSKEVLYEPLKELNDKVGGVSFEFSESYLRCVTFKFPAYLQENESKISAEDKGRYQNQMTRVSQIVEIFEKPDYKEEDQETGAKVVTLMNEVCFESVISHARIDISIFYSDAELWVTTVGNYGSLTSRA